MGDNPASPHGGAQEELMARVNTSVPVSARIWNYWMGGTDYYPIDKQALEQYNASGAIPTTYGSRTRSGGSSTAWNSWSQVWCRSTSGTPTPAPSTHRPCPRWAVSAESPEPRGPAVTARLPRPGPAAGRDRGM